MEAKKEKNDVELTTKEKNELKPDKDGYIHNQSLMINLIIRNMRMKFMTNELH